VTGHSPQLSAGHVVTRVWHAGEYILLRDWTPHVPAMHHTGCNSITKPTRSSVYQRLVVQMKLFRSD